MLEMINMISLWVLIPVCVVVILISATFLYLYTFPKFRGKFGEKMIAYGLKKKLNPSEYRIFNNIMLSDGEGGTTQIDHIVLSPYGIFIIETKTMSGSIYGSEKDITWTQKLGRKTYYPQNPLRQNEKHIYCFSKLVKVPMEGIFHVIAFVGECKLKKREQLPLCVTKGWLGPVEYIQTFKDEILYREDIPEIEARIFEGKEENTFRNRRAHNRYVRQIINDKKGKRPPNIKPTLDANNTPICPKCGVLMVRRESKRGAHKGEMFWGCPNYPKCRQTVQN